MLDQNALNLLSFQEQPTWIRALAIFGFFLALALFVRLAWKRVVMQWVRKTPSSLDDMLFRALRNLAVWALVLSGAYYAIAEVSREEGGTLAWPILGQVFSIAWLILAIGTALKVLNGFSKWRVEQATINEPDKVRDVATRVTFIRKLLTAVVILLGLIYILSVAGVDTSPLIAGGALTGIVIGIALQDTLSNVFAGFFLNIDRPVKIGDYIKLETGQEGFVEEVGWRYTKVRMWANNLLIVPNNKLSQSIITNFNLPAEPISVYVNCGVSYDSDLEHVERVAKQVAVEVQNTEDGGDTTWEPAVRFKEFGESAITFTTILRATEVSASYRIHHEFVKALHRAFGEEGIVIPYPIRVLQFQDGEAGSRLVKPGRA